MRTTCVVHDEMQRRRIPPVRFLMLTVNSNLYFIICRRRSAGRRKHGSVMPTPEQVPTVFLHDLLFGFYVLLVVLGAASSMCIIENDFLFQSLNFQRSPLWVRVTPIQSSYVFKLRRCRLNKLTTSHFKQLLSYEVNIFFFSTVTRAIQSGIRRFCGSTLNQLRTTKIVYRPFLSTNWHTLNFMYFSSLVLFYSFTFSIACLMFIVVFLFNWLIFSLSFVLMFAETFKLHVFPNNFTRSFIRRVARRNEQRL